jgi:hypothetical protein
MIHISQDFKKQLLRAAQTTTDNFRVAGYGPGGGIGDAKIEDTLYFQALKLIEALENVQKHPINRENPVTAFRTGMIRFTDELLKTIGNEERRKIFGELIPLEMNYDEATGIHTLKAASWKFRENYSSDVPEYQLLINRLIDGTYNITWEEKTNATVR